ncbi:MAG: alpha-2-macroglobulin family protein, partial [Rhodobacteraceae bacterium]|nr:alpha-2-macroglobulin family protein [Paracoccaceae bacterium]
VDLGILNLTGFQAPDPSAHYFGQKRLGIGLRDLYGRLIEPEGTSTARIRSGGDAGGGMRRQAPPPTEELVAFFTGPVTLGPDGVAEVAFDLPAFNGTVRLMAIAWSDSGVGQAQADVQVADPVVVTASLPRFLAPGDESRLLLEFAHAAGPAGEMALALASEGPLRLGEEAVPATLRLEEGARVRLSVPLTAGRQVGPARVVLRLTTPGGQVLEQALSVDLRDNGPEIARTERIALAPGATLRLEETVFDGLSLAGARATLSLGALSRLDAPGLLAALDSYPFGCTEQIASQALALVHFEDVARALEMERAEDLGARIAGAIQSVLLNQAAGGGFGLWYPDGGDFWLDAYVTDFLSRALARGHEVPPRAFASALDNLQSRLSYASDFEQGGEDIAYALYVLAREGAARMGDLRYYADARAEAFATPLARAQLGAALALYGDQPRADRMFRLAEAMTSRAPERDAARVWRSDYGTATRDAAGLLALATEAGSDAIDISALTERVGAALRPGRSASTQELAWSLLAAHALGAEPLPGGLSLDGEAVAGAGVRALRPGPDMPRALRNDGARPVEVTLTTFGQPLVPEPAASDGYRIARAHYTLEGEQIDPASVTAGARMVTVLTITPERGGEGRLMVSDPLPAGFEIDNPAFLRSGDIRALDWLELNATPRHAEFRDDRFLAAVDWRQDEAFRLGYVVRAITPGDYLHPAATVEDMYRPHRRGWTATGRVLVAE